MPREGQGRRQEPQGQADLNGFTWRFRARAPHPVKSPAVACPSGLRSTPRKRVTGNPRPRVQIPPPPPGLPTCTRRWGAFCISVPGMFVSVSWREGAGDMRIDSTGRTALVTGSTQASAPRSQRVSPAPAHGWRSTAAPRSPWVRRSSDCGPTSRTANSFRRPPTSRRTRARAGSWRSFRASTSSSTIWGSSAHSRPWRSTTTSGAATSR